MESLFNELPMIVDTICFVEKELVSIFYQYCKGK